MNEEQFIEYLKDFMITDYIVTFYMKDDKDHYHFENVLLLVDSDMNYYWLNDWNEGQDYRIVAFIPVNCVTSITIKENNKRKIKALFESVYRVLHTSRKVEKDND